MERLMSIFNSIKERWGRLNRSRKMGIYIISGIVIVLLLVTILITNYKHFVPLYSNLSADEAGQIKQTLDSKGIPYKLSAGGTTISVPEKQVDGLKLDLASQGIPKSGQIDYSIFGKNSNFGMTDNQFNVLQRAAMQTELENLITGISGVKSAKVMINLPEKSVWVSDQPAQASASIVLQLQPGSQLKSDQVSGLYHLVSKSVPNLPTSNIVIMDQNFNYYDENSLNNSSDSTLSAFQQQQQVKDEIEKNIRQHVQQMLGMMMGTDKVMVNVSTNIDFTQTKSKQQLVQPVDQQTMQGLVVSSEHIKDTYNGTTPSSPVGTGTNQVPNYPSSSTNGGGSSSSVNDKVNYVFNQINNDIQSSPYTLKDLGIQVMVEPPVPNQPSSLPQQSINDIKQILNTIVQTTLSQNGQALTPQQIASKSVVTIEKFNGKLPAVTPIKTATPKWIWYVAGGIGVLALIVLILLMRRRSQKDEALEKELSFSKQAQELKQAQAKIPPIEEDSSPEGVKKKQLEIMAKENPQDFVKLLRSWISEE